MAVLCDAAKHVEPSRGLLTLSHSGDRIELSPLLLLHIKQAMQHFGVLGDCLNVL